MDIGSAKPIEITDKSTFDNYLLQYPPEISELTFTNLFMWRRYYHWEWLEYEGHLLLLSRDFLGAHRPPIRENGGSLLCLPPVGNIPSDVICNIFANVKNVEFHRVPRMLWDTVQQDPRCEALGIQWQDDRDNSDYVYECAALITLSGGSLKPKRKWLNRFLDHFQYEFHLLSQERPELLDACKRAQETWCTLNACEESQGLVEEHDAIMTAIEHYSELKFEGAVICVGGECIAYTLGELLNPDSIVIHIEKAHVDYEGAYQAIMSLFLEQGPFKDVIYSNREQDLGDPGLRRAKESYLPHHMVEKGILFI